jgi:hypothetical protein
MMMMMMTKLMKWAIMASMTNQMSKTLLILPGWTEYTSSSHFAVVMLTGIANVIHFHKSMVWAALYLLCIGWRVLGKHSCLTTLQMVSHHGERVWLIELGHPAAASHARMPVWSGSSALRPLLGCTRILSAVPQLKSMTMHMLLLQCWTDALHAVLRQHMVCVLSRASDLACGWVVSSWASQCMHAAPMHQFLSHLMDLLWMWGIARLVWHNAAYLD